MTSSPRTFLIIGSTENWDRSFQHNPPVWGFTEKERQSWESLEPGDILYFYAAGTARGIIGKGILLNKFQGNDPYWREEKEVGRVKWNLRFYIQPHRLLPQDMWRASKGPVACSEFGITGAQLQGNQIKQLKTDQVAKTESKMVAWPVVAVGYIEPIKEVPSVSQEKPAPIYSADSHTGLVKLLEVMGTLQNFYPQTEFSIPQENRRIDIVWRREVRGTPTYAFEVELSGGLDKAVNKLYKCFRLWSTLPRVVTPSPETEKLHNIASSFEQGFQRSLVSITPSQIEDLYHKKRSFKELEKDIGLL